MKTSNMRLCITTAIGLAVMVGCSPKLASPDTTTPNEWIYGDQIASDTLHLSATWWECFADTTLNRLITRALDNNRDIEAAATKVVAARANTKVVRSSYLPALRLDGEAENTYTYSTKNVQEYFLEPTISWELSLFGALKFNNRKSRAELAESEWALRAMRLSIAAEVATTYFTLCQAQNNLAIAIRSCQLREQEVILTDSMFYYGMSSGIDMEQARSLLYTARADINQYRRAAEQTQLSLTLLLGEKPSHTPIDITESVIPPTIPVGLPSDLLERRPDIQQSYYTMAAAAAEVGIARAARYPTITLTGEGGLLSSTLKGLFQDQPFAWSATAELIQPIFGFGRLKNSEKAARAKYMESLYSYEQSMLTAFSEVEQALVAVASYGSQRSAMVDLVIANGQISQSVGALYDSGMNDYLNVIDAERELYDSQMELEEIIANQYISYVTLFKALGGGY